MAAPGGVPASAAEQRQLEANRNSTAKKRSDAGRKRPKAETIIAPGQILGEPRQFFPQYFLVNTKLLCKLGINAFLERGRISFCLRFAYLSFQLRVRDNTLSQLCHFNFHVSFHLRLAPRLPNSQTTDEDEQRCNADGPLLHAAAKVCEIVS
jgi:hypothetical protein